MDLEMNLNEKQLQALNIIEGPLLIVAGAGSGKTKVLTHKIAKLINEENILPSSILAITFTNKAAKEMQERLSDLISVNVNDMWVCTFHAMGVRMLRSYGDRLGYDRSFSIYDRNDQKTLIKECIRELNISTDTYKEAVVIDVISECKSMNISPAEYEISNANTQFGKDMAALYRLYELKLKKYNAFDFDDLLIKAVELLEKNDDVLTYYAKKFKYVFVDEYQDTNKIQYKLIKLLTEFNNNICVVGDSDQSIYGWRGADITNILDFEKDFKDAKVVLLEQNYRSTGKILDLANTVIKNNTERLKKNLWTENNSGDDVVYTKYEHSDLEAKGVADRIQNLSFNNNRLKDIAILYRTNAQSRVFEEMLIKSGIPYKLVGGLKFYDRKEIKDIISYLRLLVNPDDNIAFKRVVNLPKRGIGDASIQKIEDYALLNGKSLFEALREIDSFDFLSTKASRALKDFKGLITVFSARLGTSTIEDLYNDYMSNTGYLEMIKSERTIESQTRLENIDEFLSVITAYEANNPDGTLSDLLNEISLLSDVDKTDDVDNAVTLMTIHSAKGLEFSNVFLTGLEEGLFPNARLKESEHDIEEERRLCYVAITRAKERLYISSCSYRTLYGKTSPAMESRFISEMENKYTEDGKKRLVVTKDFTMTTKKINTINKGSNVKVENINKPAVEIGKFKVGDKVSHKTLGTGTVVSITNTGGDCKLVISFDTKGLRTLMESLAGLIKA